MLVRVGHLDPVLFCEVPRVDFWGHTGSQHPNACFGRDPASPPGALPKDGHLPKHRDFGVSGEARKAAFLQDVVHMCDECCGI